MGIYSPPCGKCNPSDGQLAIKQLFDSIVREYLGTCTSTRYRPEEFPGMLGGGLQLEVMTLNGWLEVAAAGSFDVGSNRKGTLAGKCGWILAVGMERFIMAKDGIANIHDVHLQA